MPTHLAKYTINAVMIDGGAWMPDPEPHKREYKFDATDEAEAKKLAEDHTSAFYKEFFGPSVSLDELLEVKDVKFKDVKLEV